MRIALRELEQASYHHEQWAENLHGTLVCRAVPDEKDLGPDAHCQCHFGQWYSHTGSIALRNHPGFQEIGIEHERMHRYAAHLLRASRDGGVVARADYERFVGALKRMNLEMANVREELQRALFNLDPLTGVPSRIGMLTALREQQEYVRQNHCCVVAMLDLDHFKSINDNYGHMVGDTVLVEVARWLMGHLRPYDKIYRYGGEEFLICLPGTDMVTGNDILNRFIEGIAGLPFAVEGKDGLRVTASVGLADLGAHLPVERSIEHADRALYLAKGQGRNRVVLWDVAMDELPSERKST
jgi:diguanylate cyclase (GGDEF)-like protein